MRVPSNRREAGLTLIEILVALAIIGLAFAALASLQISNLRVTRDSKLASIATQVGNEAMEQVVKEFLAQVDSSTSKPVFTCGGASYMACSGTLGIQVDDAAYAATYNVAVNSTTGIATVTVDVDDPKAVSFSQLVSCMDVVPPPSFAEPAPCPNPSGGG